MDSVKRQGFRALEVAGWWDRDPLLYKSGCFYPLFPLCVLFSFCFKVPNILVSLRELRAELYLCSLARTWRESWPWRLAWQLCHSGCSRENPKVEALYLRSYYVLLPFLEILVRTKEVSLYWDIFCRTWNIQTSCWPPQHKGIYFRGK